MSDNIFGDRFISRQRPAWHNLGQVFPLDERLSVTEAARRAGAEFQIQKGQMCFRTPEGQVIDGENDEMVVFRGPVKDDPVHRVFGTCKKDYTPLQNMEVAAILDEALAGAGFPVETLGVLGHGERVFVGLRGEDFAVKNVDEIRSYFVVDINHVPGRGNAVLYTPVRVVCWNTLNMAHGSAKIKLNLPHIGNPAEMLRFGSHVLRDMAKARKEAELTFNAMADRRTTIEEARAVFEAAWEMAPRPKRAHLIDGLSQAQLAERMADPKTARVLSEVVKSLRVWEYWETRVTAYRQGAMARLEAFNDQHPRFANTAWAVYNAATETSDWRNGGKKVDEATLFGDRAREKERAFKAVVDLL